MTKVTVLVSNKGIKAAMPLPTGVWLWAKKGSGQVTG